MAARPSMALAFLALVLLYACHGGFALSSPESLEDESSDSKSSSSSSDSGDKAPADAIPLEAEDMNKDEEQATPDTVAVDHPNVVDPRTTHEEGSHPKPHSNGTGAVTACNLPLSLFRDDDDGDGSVVSDWLADTDNFTHLCSIPQDWFHSNSSGDIHICSIPREWWENNNGTLTKELLSELNDTSISCVTPTQILSNTSSAENVTVNGTIPRAWLRDSNDNIYIYFIPREWLKKRGHPEKAHDSYLGEETSASPSPATNATTLAPLNETTHIERIPEKTVPVETNVTSLSQPNKTSSSQPNSTTSSQINTTSSSQLNTTTPAQLNVTEEPVKPTPIPIPPESSNNATEKQKDEPAAKTTVPKSTQASVNASSTSTTTTSTTSTTTTATTTTTSTTTTTTTMKPKDEDNEVVPPRSTLPSLPEALSQQHSDHDRPSTSGKTAFLQPTESAAILAGVFVAIALLGYVGLLLWRRVLEKRYGNREMLVNEDDDFDTSDMRHFEL